MINYENQRSKYENYLYFQDDVNLTFVKHFHNTYEFIFVSEGEIECEVGSTTYTLTKGKAILIFPHQLHSYITHNHSISHLVVFSKDYIQAFHNEVKGNWFENPVINYNDNNKYHSLKTNKHSKFLVKSILYEICDKCYKNSKLIKIAEVQDELSAQIITYIQKNYTDDISLKNIAADLNYNYTYLSNYFNKSFHSSFPDFLNAYRLEHAIHLLDHTDEKIINISESSGFATIRAFNYTFKAKYGISPREYRKL